MAIPVNSPRLQPAIALLAITQLFLGACAPVQKQDVVDKPADYVPDANYHVLMGEMAMQRGEYFVTAKEFSEAARLSDEIDVVSRAAEYTFDYGFDRFALKNAARWAELEPYNAKAHGLLALLYLRLNDADKAFYHLQLSLPPPEGRRDDDYVSLGGSIAAETSPATRLAVMQRFGKTYGPTAGTQVAITEAAISAGQGKTALEAARSAIEIRPNWPKARIAGCRAQLAVERVDAALACMRNLLETDSGLEQELAYVRLLVAAEQFDVALAYLDDMEERRGFLPEISRMHGLISFDRDDQVAAWSDFNKLLTSGYFENESLYYLGQMSQRNREFLPALRFYSRIRSGYLLVSAQVEIAQILSDAGNLDGGIQHLNDFYQQFPTLGFELWTAKAALLGSAGQFDRALTAYQKALEYQSDNINLLLGRAAVLDEMGEFDASVKQFRAALQLAPDNADALNALGYTLANRNRRLGEAGRLIERALKQYPDNAAYLDSKGWLLYRRGDLKGAEKYLERAYALNEDPEIAAHLGELMWAQGRDGEASIIWMLALENYPNDRALIDTVQRYMQP